MLFSCDTFLHLYNPCSKQCADRRSKTPEYKLKCGVNALALLLSVRNKKFTNDVRLLFGLLCASYGAGKQFINMLNAVGLSSHWNTT